MPLLLSHHHHYHHHYHYHFLSSKPPFLPLYSSKSPFFFIPNPNPNHKPLQSNLHSSSSTSTSAETLPQSAIQRIADKLRTLGFAEDTPNSQLPQQDETPNYGEIFIPDSCQIPSYRVGHTLDPSWSSPNNPVPDPGSGNALVNFHELRGVVKKERRIIKGMEKREGEVPTLAQLTLAKSEIRRLTTIGLRMTQKMKLGKAGITEGIVNGIHERWRKFEVVKIVCDDICKLNMKRTHDLLERKTGGLVVWRAGSKIILYRGLNYKYPYFSLDEASVNDNSQNATDSDDDLQVREESFPSEMPMVESSEDNSRRVLGQPGLVQGVGSPNRLRFLMPGEKQLVDEADQLLEGLGPRFSDWWGCDPLPVDADFLPAVVTGYRKPFRLLPYGVKPKLTNDEMTILKRLGRPLPCHFALGRNRNFQGLAAAILKLWEKCEIAKIAIKRGVQNTNSELMAEELKRLTGGTMLSRDKEYIVFYRGKDFLPSAVSSAIEERRKSRRHLDKQLTNVSSTVTSDETEASVKGHVSVSENKTSRVQKMPVFSLERKIKSIESAITRTSRKLSVALEEKAKAEKLLSELEQAEISQQGEVDKEGITEEEKYMLRKVGLKMKPFLLLGRRGVFDGTIENMHLHWKYRELVKIICGGRNIDEIHRVARILEAESGGILVAVERDRKGFAIIVYRGKNYQRPACLRPETLLNKKEALKRSIEAQRRQSLKLNVLKLAENVEELKVKLVKDQEALDTHTTDEQLKSQELVEHELGPTMLNGNTNPQEAGLSSAQQEKLISTSPHHKAHEISDYYSSGSVDLKVSPNSVLHEKTNEGGSFNDDDHEVECSKMDSVAPKDSGNDARDKLLHSARNQLEATTNSVSEDSFEHYPVETEMIRLSKVLAPPFDKTTEKASHVVSARARPLTNKERLLLRRQALKTKRRPVLAVGKSNVVTGIAKAILDHFKKHSLAIVNVKGRAKGTSVQEVVFQLEQETGAVLVSQEPSHIILYRGWGGGVDATRVYGGVNDKPSLAVSPELVEAMRLECGLSIDQERDPI